MKISYGIDVDLDNIPIDDELTYQLYQKGQTIGTFQFESPGMQKILRQFQPFGPGNIMPVFLTENVYDDGMGRKVGPDARHLKLNLIQEAQPYNPKPAIGFNMADYYPYISGGNPIDICYSVVENYFNKNTTIQLRLKDIHKRDELI